MYYSQFHKTLPKSSLPMHWISVRFYEMGDIIYFGGIRDIFPDPWEWWWAEFLLIRNNTLKKKNLKS